MKFKATYLLATILITGCGSQTKASKIVDFDGKSFTNKLLKSDINACQEIKKKITYCTEKMKKIIDEVIYLKDNAKDGDSKYSFISEKVLKDNTKEVKWQANYTWGRYLFEHMIAFTLAPDGYEYKFDVTRTTDISFKQDK